MTPPPPSVNHPYKLVVLRTYCTLERRKHHKITAVVIYNLDFAHFHARFIGALTHPVSFDPGR